MEPNPNPTYIINKSSQQNQFKANLRGKANFYFHLEIITFPSVLIWNASSNHQSKTPKFRALTDKENVTTRYGQKSFDIENQINTFVNIVFPKDKNKGNA